MPGVVHDFGAICQQRHFLTSTGKPIQYHQLIADLLQAILLPFVVAVCKCAAHTSATDDVSRGNAPADAAAKAAACSGAPIHTMSSLTAHLESEDIDCAQAVCRMQDMASPVEKRLWSSSGCSHDYNSIWLGSNDNPCLPNHFFPHYAKLTHGLDHVSKGGMLTQINQHWFTRGFSVVAQAHCEKCTICMTHNVSRPIQPKAQAAHTPPTCPFEHIMMDFIELTPSEGKKYCLVMVDMWSKWVEVFPTSKCNAQSVAKALLRDIIPRWGIPDRLSSDNGAHFANTALAEMSSHFGFDLRKHCAYHPASGVAVERENGTLKCKLAKCCEERGFSWTKALPIVLMYMRMRKRIRTNLSLFEILFAAPPHMGIEPQLKKPLSTTHCQNAMLTYCANLSSTLTSIRKQVADALPAPAQRQLHDLKPGDFIIVKDFRRKSWKSRRWLHPF